ncbi:hypothetical protein BLNAU_12784 [Blattamonas nauphoetae]|uniref:B30.2/SPRY domain-containing protein n=1 Tax=Blattamonas nauphoetae TaxID=2049346 RepID=A0ABQ9XQ48_9EUKA|nr:hypothetical protein BLNAU_12784 [Blattamonas nauphoetae]
MSSVLDDNDTLSVDPQTDTCLPSSCINFSPTHLQTLPPLIFSSQKYFTIHRTTIARTKHDRDNYGTSYYRSVVFSNPFTSGVVTVTITVLSIPDGNMCFGLMDSTSRIPEIDEALGYDVKNSVSLNAYGHLNFSTPSSNSYEDCHSDLKEGDCVRIEVDLDSTPRTVQFFVNDGTGRFYMSGIPSSVRIGFSVKGEEISFRIDNISRLSQPTPISEEMKEVKL